MRDERRASAVAFLEAAVSYYASLGVKIERVMRDNGSCYLWRAFGQACKTLGLKHIRTRPYTPKTTDVIDKCFLAASGLFFLSRTGDREAKSRA
jgi:transposase InsO family protein